MEVGIAILVVLWILYKVDLGDLWQELSNLGSSRSRRPAFKTRHNLTERQPLEEFEERMAKGMLQEDGEVWVTAFCDGKEAVTATATVGSVHKCEPSDDIFRWPDKCQRLGAEEVRWYHNHPDGLFKSLPSKWDKRTHHELQRFLENRGIRFRSFLVYPSIFSYRIKEFGK